MFAIRPTALRNSAQGCVISVLLLSWTAGGTLGQIVIEPSGRYDPGTEVIAPAAGVAFTVPMDLSGHMDVEAELFLMSGSSVQAAVWAYSDGTPDDLANLIGADLTDLGVVLTEDSVERDDQGIQGWYDALTGEGRGRLFGIIRSGPDGAVFGAAALGPAGADEQLEQAIRSVVESLRWTTPHASEWRASIAGTVLVGGSAHSDFNRDDYGDNHLSQAGQEYAEITLCRDGTYSLESESKFSVSTPDVSVYSGDSDAHTGGWSLIADVAGNAYLVLEPWDRDEVVFEMSLSEGRILLDERTFETSAAPC